MSNWLTVSEAANVLGVHPNTIRNFIKSKKLTAYRLGNRLIRIKPEDLKALYRESANVR